jgi:hypothetical protein
MIRVVVCLSIVVLGASAAACVKVAPALMPTVTSQPCEPLVIGEPRSGQRKPPSSTAALTTCLNELRREVATASLLDARAEEDARKAAEAELLDASRRLNVLATDAVGQAKQVTGAVERLQKTVSQTKGQVSRDELSKQRTAVEAALKEALGQVGAEATSIEERTLIETRRTSSLADLEQARKALETAVASALEANKAVDAAADPAPKDLVDKLAAEWRKATAAAEGALKARAAALQAEAAYLDLQRLGQGVRTAADTAARSLAASRLTYAQHYLAYKRLGRLYWHDSIKDVPDANLDAAFGMLAESLHEALDRNGLFAPFSATLIAGAAMNFTEGGLKAASENTFEVGQVMKVVAETKHFGEEKGVRPFDASAGATLGLEPVRALFVKPGTTSDLALGFMNGLAWSAFGKLNLTPTQTGEIPLFLRVGQGIPSKGSLGVTGADGKPASLTPVANGDAASGRVIDVGAEWHYFGKPMELVHAEKSFFDPPFAMGLWYRWDERLDTTDLPPAADGSAIAYQNAGGGAKRLVFRVSVAPAKFTKDPAKPDQVVSFGFSVEYERALGCSSSCVPSTTRVVIRGDVDLVKAFTGVK